MYDVPVHVIGHLPLAVKLPHRHCRIYNTASGPLGPGGVDSADLKQTWRLALRVLESNSTQMNSKSETRGLESDL